MYRDLLSYLVWYNCFFVRKRERSAARANNIVRRGRPKGAPTNG